MKVALIVGHTEASQGASNIDGTTEFIYNDEQCKLAAVKLIEAGHEPFIVFRSTYSQLPHRVNLLKPDLAISFHCNAFNKRTSGSEVLHYHRSVKGKAFAKILQRETLKAIGLLNRGLKAIRTAHNGKAGDRGGLLVRYTKMPCVIWEPFFIDNDEDLSKGIDYRNELIDGLVKAVSEYENTM